MALFPIITDADTKPFLDAAERGEFLLVRSKSTGEYFEPRTDPTLDDDLEYAAAAGTGTVISWTIAHGKDRDGNPTRTGLGIVELTEGPWWWTRIDGIGSDSPTGKPVHVEFEKSGPGEIHATVPYFVMD
ncbi:putative OB-fold protein [Pseudarthrobacter siccitolerans]|uniref:OB-fold protein n=1 Tax=Pseudarthrobacter siccitolerans TaxID=861266 RepID=A0ABU0PL47_9MICC|nr:OB-fold domain-containing protein [Pseudarthrobacter siccitolerans]MDQ0674700.1 putative OB-fold protein [Pseudarthrobacter siccitolerans]